MTKLSSRIEVLSDPYILFPEYKNDKSVFFKSGIAYSVEVKNTHDCDCQFCLIKEEINYEWYYDEEPENYIDREYYVSAISILSPL